MKFILSLALFAAAAHGSVIYSSIPGTLPPNVPSLGYEATSTSEFGGLITFGGADRLLTAATLVISEWAPESQYEPVGTSTGFLLPMALNIYNVGAGNTVGSLIGSSQITPTVLWRPEADLTCTTGVWRASNGLCYNGFAQTVTFNFADLLVPDTVIYGLAFNTQHYGYLPTATPGPANSTNFGLATTGPSVGSNPLPDTAYWNHGSGFVQDSGWTPYSGAIEFQSTSPTPEPAAAVSFLGGILLLTGLLRHRKSFDHDRQ